MSKILVAYVLSLMGYPVWSAPVEPLQKPAVTAPTTVEVAASRPARPRPPAAPHAEVAAAPPAGSADVAASPTDATAAKPSSPTIAAKTDAATTAADAGTATPPADATPAAPAEAAPAEGELTADQIITRVQELYDGTTSFQANFRQVFRHRLNPERSKEATGVVYLQKPGKMRWEYHDPERKLIVSDGTTLWAYEPEDNQVFEQSLSDTDLPSAVSFLLGSGSLATEFDVRLVEEGADTSPDRYVLELRPKTPSSQYSRLVFLVDRSSFQVVRTVVFDHSGNTNSIEFAGITLNGDIPASQFRFVRPEGARVIR
ncbi:MAG: outer membrane lipoprotein carrier protein LolA [Deltaproteobacteria bacterium]|nr:outer membrane lipoprotein carrier protein LolA [Deltaproteobacteria bacterium]